MSIGSTIYDDVMMLIMNVKAAAAAATLGSIASLIVGEHLLQLISLHPSQESSYHTSISHSDVVYVSLSSSFPSSMHLPCMFHPLLFMFAP